MSHLFDFYNLISQYVLIIELKRCSLPPNDSSLVDVKSHVNGRNLLKIFCVECMSYHNLWLYGFSIDLLLSNVCVGKMPNNFVVFVTLFHE